MRVEGEGCVHGYPHAKNYLESLQLVLDAHLWMSANLPASPPLSGCSLVMRLRYARRIWA